MRDYVCKAILKAGNLDQQGEKRVVGSMGPGEFFGELALIRQNSTRAADCIATQRTKVLPSANTFFQSVHHGTAR